MSDPRRDTRGARFDEAIDRAVREMLDVEPPAGLRGRVLDRIENPRFRNPAASAFRRKAWVFAPVAAAGIVVLAVMLSWRGERPAVPPVTAIVRDVRLPLPATGGTPPRPEIVPRALVATGRSRPPRGERKIEATVVAADEEFLGAQLEALSGPAPITIDRLAGPAAPSVNTMGVAPIQIRALEVSALTATPPERREE